jgi:hypothetical protein
MLAAVTPKVLRKRRPARMAGQGIVEFSLIAILVAWSSLSSSSLFSTK